METPLQATQATQETALFRVSLVMHVPAESAVDALHHALTRTSFVATVTDEQGITRAFRVTHPSHGLASKEISADAPSTNVATGAF